MHNKDSYKMRDSRKNDNYKPNAMVESGAKAKAKYDAINFRDKDVDNWRGRIRPSNKRRRAGNTSISGLRSFGDMPRLKGY